MNDGVPETASDEELLQRHLRGEPAAFAGLVERYTPELFRFLMRFLGRRAMAEDVMQETFLQVHVSAADFDAGRRVKPWLFTIAANKARDSLRSRNRRREVSADPPVTNGSSESFPSAFELAAGDDELPGAELARREDAERVRDVVMSLPEHLREVLIMGYFHRFPYREMADILQVPIGTIKSRLHAAVMQFGAAYRRLAPAAAPAMTTGSVFKKGVRKES